MKIPTALAALLFVLPSSEPPPASPPLPEITGTSHNLIIVTIDGFRWKELFSGADEKLISNTDVTADTSTLKLLYWDEDPLVRRSKLMPFMWNVVARKGQLWGNRELGNKMNTANIYSVSYPGYSELLTGTTDLRISSNSKKNNPHVNVLAWLNDQPSFEGRVAAFSSWDVFPYILNEEKSSMPVNSGYELLPATENSEIVRRLNWLQEEGVQEKGAVRQDQISFLAAKEYLAGRKPRVLFIGLGETDEFAHHGQYGEYLEQANRIDRMLADLWHWVQRTPGYRDQTTLLVTTDHGRGNRNGKWTSHSAFIRGSSQTWMAVMGPGIAPLGEIQEEAQLYQQDLAAFMAALVGEEFRPAYWSALRRDQAVEKRVE